MGSINFIKKVKHVGLVSSCALAILFACNNSADAAVSQFALGANVGTPGLGVEARTPINQQIFGRIGVNYLDYKHDFDDGQIKLKGELRLITVPLMLDYHPIQDSGFRVSAGVAYNGNMVKAKGRASKNVTLYGRTYTADQIGQVSSKLKLGNNVAGVVSLGYDSSLMDNSPLSFACEFGVMVAGKPKLKINTSAAEAIINSSGATKQQKDIAMQAIADVKRDAQKSLDKVDKYLRYYPIVSLGFKYSF